MSRATRALAALFAALLLFVGLPACADVTGVYRATINGAELRFEVAADGDFRNSIKGQPREVLSRDGILYLVYPDEPAVERVDDLEAVLAEFDPLPLPLGLRGLDWGRQPSFVERGTERIGGRSGRAYLIRFGGDPPDPRPFFVMSDDPALAPLGLAVTAHFALGRVLAASQGFAPPDFGDAWVAILRTGTPLRFALFLDLAEFSTAPIPPERFELPAEPRTREAIRARLRAAGLKEKQR